MYPLTGGFMDYVQGGGLPGLFIKGGKDLLGNITGMGKDIASAVGITGTVERLIDNDKVEVEIAENVKVEIVKSTGIQSLVNTNTQEVKK